MRCLVGGKFREVTVALLSEHPSYSPVFRKPLLAWPCGASLGVSWSSEHPLCFPDVKMSLLWDHDMQGKSADVMVALSSQGPSRRLTIMKGNFVDAMVALSSQGPSRRLTIMKGNIVDVMVALSSQGPSRRLTTMKGNFVDVMVTLSSEGPSRCIHTGYVKRKAPR